MNKFTIEDRPDNRAVIVADEKVTCAEVWTGGYATCAEMVRLANNAGGLFVALERAERWITTNVENHGREVARILELDPEEHAAIFVAECTTLQAVRAAMQRTQG